jgi:gamma-glutamyltranspeptidase/glutathione hydrolase
MTGAAAVHPSRRKAIQLVATTACALALGVPVLHAQERPEASGIEAGIVSDHPLATAAGAQVLQRGGNAVDAAITMAGVLSVVRPHMNGMGGDAFMLIYDAKTKRVHALNGSGRAGSLGTPAFFQQRGLKEVPTYGILSVTVPGAVQAWSDALRRFGTISLSAALQPGIRYAERGFPLTPKFRADLVSLKDRVAADPALASVILRDGEVPEAGSLIRQPDLARSLRLVADRGPAAFYRGELAGRIASFMAREGGLITAADLGAHRSEWMEPVQTTFNGYKVFALPPNSQGLAMLMQLNAGERLALKAMGHNSADYIHNLVQIKKAVFAERDRYISDPAFTKVPVDRLLSKQHAAELVALQTSDASAVVHDSPVTLRPGSFGSARHWEGDTVVLIVTDKAGNVAVLIESLFHFLGSGRMVPGTGILLQNRGSSFSLDASHVNVMAPGKRPYHTLSPALVLDSLDAPYFALATPGGDGQTQTLVQVLYNIVLFGMHPQAAVEAPRWRSHEDLTLALEPGIPESVQRELARRGHSVVVHPPSEEYGGAQVVLVHPRSKARITGADERREAFSIAW